MDNSLINFIDGATKEQLTVLLELMKDREQTERLIRVISALIA